MRRFTIHCFLLLGALGLVVLAGPGWADAQQRKRGSTRARPAAPAQPSPAPAQPARSDRAKVFDFTGLDVSGRLRAPQLLYFLDRAHEELQRASLERRSFLPEMVRTLDEEAL